MAQKKDIRSDNTYLISQDTTDNPKLGAKILSDGRKVYFWITTLVTVWFITRDWIRR